MKRRKQIIEIRTGRPTKLTPELAQQVVTLVAEGAYFSTAAWACGIDSKTLAAWDETGEAHYSDDKDTIFAEFFRSLRIAEANAEIDALRQMKRGGVHYIGAATFLERRHRARWGRGDKLTVEGTVKHDHDVIGLRDKLLANLAGEVERA